MVCDKYARSNIVNIFKWWRFMTMDITNHMANYVEFPQKSNLFVQVFKKINDFLTDSFIKKFLFKKSHIAWHCCIAKIIHTLQLYVWTKKNYIFTIYSLYSKQFSKCKLCFVFSSPEYLWTCKSWNSRNKRWRCRRCIWRILTCIYICEKIIYK